MAFTTPTLAQAQADLASRLNDPSYVHWLQSELTGYLREALRTWNVWCQQWRAQGTFATTLAQTFYDLPTVLPTLRGQTVTNWDLVTDLQYALLEPAAAGGTWTGTAQYTLNQLTAAIQRRRDQFLRDTGCVLTTSTPVLTPPSSGRIALDEAVLFVRRADWKPTATQLNQPLMRTDEFAATHFAPAWVQNTESPFAYSVSATPPLTMQLIPPNDGLEGTLELVSVNKGVVLGSGTETILGIPNDFLWVVKYGALSDLLSNDGLALDPQRAQYCEARYKQGVELAIKATVVLATRIANITCRVSSLADADAYDPLWGLLPGVPQDILIAGQTLIATSPRAGGGSPFTITVDVVQNAPIPVNPNDVLQVSQDVYESILDIAQHSALFKDGPGALQLAMALYDKAMAAAGVSQSIQQAIQPSRRPLLRQSQQDRQTNPEVLETVPVE